MTRSRPRFAASINEAPVYAACGTRYHCDRGLYPRAQSRRRPAGAHGYSLQNLVLFPQVGRAQAVKGVRKLVARKYPYLVYYRVDEAAKEVIILTIQHAARQREYEDA
jgi:plasmid stabilization system protein ParE